MVTTAVPALAVDLVCPDGVVNSSDPGALPITNGGSGGPAATAPMQTSPSSIVRMAIDCELRYELQAPCEFLFLIHPTHGMGQYVIDESLEIEPPTPCRGFVDAALGNRFMRLQAAAGPLRLHLLATVDRTVQANDEAAPEVAIHDLPDHTLPYLLPTRYCESDHLSNAAQKIFGGVMPGHSRVQAISDWVRSNVDYRIGSTTATTTAREVFVQRAGVCRDFAHLSVTLCRALNIPARLVVGYARFSEPPPDFHAVFEAWLGGQWVMFDPTGMAPLRHLVRAGTGRDAKDVAFATIFGPAQMVSMSPKIEPIGLRGEGADSVGTRPTTAQVPLST